MLYYSPQGTYTADEIDEMIEADRYTKMIGIAMKYHPINGRETNSMIEALKVSGEFPDE